MPNLVMEYSHTAEERLNLQGLLQDLHQVALDCDLFDSRDVKSRSHRYHQWLIGERGDTEDFIHIHFELLAGRSMEQKQVLADALLAVLQQQASHISSLTVNMVDMDKACFRKLKNITL
ncbi:5-carboxymethyl-2-hydroxymuconate Delta-isomerase [Vibrio hippocampi]|uniref:5-carboxymethyl-2-hydroxymuconate isomerase n=1 Tax=Vibrio hippocampi TaxID=654686 RepID=A0ABN8DGD6_9VIBR|nr:5-carboxymethyl-2-hydroxymuconate Delta-isomerase [Vibrio hippocampi]CAH0524429.1 hypothetical protein VHP8226_00256 [Vibrio hippocampi]